MKRTLSQDQEYLRQAYAEAVEVLKMYHQQGRQPMDLRIYLDLNEPDRFDVTVKVRKQ